MRTLRDDDGTRYLLLKRSGESSLVRDPETGEERYVRNDRLTDVDGESPLETAAREVPPALRRLLAAVRDDRALGLLLEVDRRGPLAVRDLMAAYDLCESDTLGLLTEFRAAGLVERADVVGEPGYDTTDDARRALVALRERTDDSA
ncbi:DUF7346 family protein [Halomarina ordinaria]|uniref:MarR family transcriptional regulator n=1 Tax=Halomarina ordinaria TaxID=3033939 RepID=A0ABD5UAH0_9EURY|nr:hypothetical protein [Halomarina sp. PSRA2]